MEKAASLPMRCKAIQREAFTSSRLPTIPASQNMFLNIFFVHLSIRRWTGGCRQTPRSAMKLRARYHAGHLFVDRRWHGLKDCTGDRARHCAAANARKLVRKSVSVDLLRHTTRD